MTISRDPLTLRYQQAFRVSPYSRRCALQPLIGDLDGDASRRDGNLLMTDIEGSTPIVGSAWRQLHLAAPIP